MSLLEVAEVTLASAAGAVVGPWARPAGCRRDRPYLRFRRARMGDRARASADNVVLRHGGQVLRRVPVDGERPDVAEQFPDSRLGRHERLLHAGRRVEPGAELRARPQRAPRGGRGPGSPAISGRRSPLRTGFEPSIEPIVLTALGRTGSTAVTRLLAAHPAVAAYRPFEYEPRVVTYWIDVLRALAEPGRFRRQIAPNGPLDGPLVGRRARAAHRDASWTRTCRAGSEATASRRSPSSARAASRCSTAGSRRASSAPAATYFVEKLGPDTGALLSGAVPRRARALPRARLP